MSRNEHDTVMRSGLQRLGGPTSAARAPTVHPMSTLSAKGSK